MAEGYAFANLAFLGGFDDRVLFCFREAIMTAD